MLTVLGGLAEFERELIRARTGEGRKRAKTNGVKFGARRRRRPSCRRDRGTKPGLGRMAKAKSIGWAIYTAGFVIWLFGYLGTGHAAVFDWDVAAPSWISSFVPNLEAEFGLALMFTSMIPIYWRAGRKRP